MQQNPRIERYLRLLSHERDAHGAVVRSLRDLPEPGRSDDRYRRAVDLLHHVAAARRVWLDRVEDATRPPRAVFPAGAPLGTVERELEEAVDVWAAYLREAADDDLRSAIAYRNSKGVPFRNTVEDVLTHLFGHSLYHRGQIALLVRTLGGGPAVTDFIFWARWSEEEPPIR